MIIIRLSKVILFALITLAFWSGVAQAKKNDDECVRDADCLINLIVEAAPEMASIKRLMEVSPSLRKEFVEGVEKVVQAKRNGQDVNIGALGAALFQKHIIVHAWKGPKENIIGYWQEGVLLAKHLEKRDPQACVDLWNGQFSSGSRLNAEGRAIIGRMIGHLADAYVEGSKKTMTPMSPKNQEKIAASMFSRKDIVFTQEELDSFGADSSSMNKEAYCIGMGKFIGGYLNPATPEHVDALRSMLTAQ